MAGRYGGTYARTDIAFEFASWISVEFKLYLVKEFQRLKENKFLSMSKARREEIENINIRSDYLERLAKAKIILPPNNFFVAYETDNDYNVPWF